MRILSCVAYNYSGNPNSASYEYLSFVTVLRGMGHTVHHFEYRAQAQISRDAMNEFFLAVVRTGGYDLVLVVTHKDEFDWTLLDEVRRHTVSLAWNCDDDWRWADYSAKLAPHFTFMATTYRHIYEANRGAHPNLLLSQWGCTGLDEGYTLPKVIPISFVGYSYGPRRQQLQRLSKAVGLAAYGRGVREPDTLVRKLRRGVARLAGVSWVEPDRELPDQSAVKAVWNQSRLSFTPLEASTGAQHQIKARVFDMGLSGTVMLASKTPALHEFYTPSVEYIEFESVEECIEKARYLLQHESERARLAERYYERTRREHLWIHRFDKLFREMGVGANH